jgi:ammonia channel protein AmtB
MVLGTALLWIGWFGFNGGSALGGNLRAVSACVSTHVAACAGGTTSLLWFWMWSALARAGAAEGEEEHKVPSVTHFCDGAVIGLVAITPAAGYVSLHSSLCRPPFPTNRPLGACVEFGNIWSCVGNRGVFAEAVHQRNAN